MNVRKKLFLHIGAHKTGTTFIQREVFRHDRLLGDSDRTHEFLSIHHPDANFQHFRQLYTAARNRGLSLLDKGQSMTETRNAMTSAFREYLRERSADVLVLSDENILGQTPGHPIGGKLVSANSLYPLSRVVAEAVYDLSDAYDISVRLSDRKMTSFITSCYRDMMMKLCRAETEEAFRARLHYDSFDWDKVAAPWTEIFGDAFSRNEFESLARDPQGYASDFSQWCGLQWDKDAKGFDKQVNQSLSPRQIDIALKVMESLRPEETDLLRRFILKIAP